MSRKWQDRLLQREYPLANAIGRPAALSVRIEHAGVSQYFPLGTADPDKAASVAEAISNFIIRRGWEAACLKYPREVTLAVHWVLNPVAWTYTTFHTQPKDERVPQGRGRRVGLHVGIIEPEEALQRSLRRWVDAHEGVGRVLRYSSPEQALEVLKREPTRLWLVNRTLPGLTGNECIQEMKSYAPELCALIYSVYEDSNQLFLATPGGASAYLLKRTAPDRLLEPAAGKHDAKVFTHQELLVRVRDYFEKAMAIGSAGESLRDLENLTPREQELLALLSKGYLDKEIATRLGISAWTVRGHLKHIFGKLNVHTRTEAAVRFLHK